MTAGPAAGGETDRRSGQSGHSIPDNPMLHDIADLTGECILLGSCPSRGHLRPCPSRGHPVNGLGAGGGATAGPAAVGETDRRSDQSGHSIHDNPMLHDIADLTGESILLGPRPSRGDLVSGLLRPCPSRRGSSQWVGCRRRSHCRASRRRDRQKVWAVWALRP